MTRKSVGWLLILFALYQGASGGDLERAEQLGLQLADAPALRRPIYPGLLGDAYAHNNAAETTERWGSAYTLSHEATHGANAVIRKRYGDFRVANAMYVGNNRAIVIKEPAVTLDVVARFVPHNMRGMAYKLTLVYFALPPGTPRTYNGMPVEDWREQTLYVFDELSAYTAGTRFGDSVNNIRSSDALQMAEHAVYAICATAAVRQYKPEYDITQMRAALAWMIERRVNPLLDRPGSEKGKAYWDRFRTSAETENLRQFMRGCFGKAWSKQVMGF